MKGPKLDAMKSVKVVLDIDRNCDVLPLLKFCTNKPILASLLRQFFFWGGKGAFRPKKGCPRDSTDF